MGSGPVFRRPGSSVLSRNRSSRLDCSNLLLARAPSQRGATGDAARRPIVSGVVVLTPDLDGDGALLSIAQHSEGHRRAGVDRSDPARQLLRLLDRLPLDDGVAPLEASLLSRTASDGFGHKRALRLFQTHRFSDILRDRLDLHADKATRDRTVLFQ